MRGARRQPRLDRVAALEREDGALGRPDACPQGGPVAGQAPGLGDPGGIGPGSRAGCRPGRGAAPRPRAGRAPHPPAAPRRSGPPRRADQRRRCGKSTIGGLPPDQGGKAQQRVSRRAGRDQPGQGRPGRPLPAAPPPSTPVSAISAKRTGRIGRRQQALQLHPDPLGRKPRQPRHRGADRGQRRRVGRARGHSAPGSGRSAAPAGSPRPAASPGRRRSAPARPPDLPPAEIIPQRAVGVHRHGVDGEVAPRRVLPPVGGPGHLGMAAVGRDVAAQAGRPRPARWSSTAVTVPCARPVSNTFSPAARSRAATASGGSGAPTSTSCTGQPRQHVPHRPAHRPRPGQRRQHRRRRAAPAGCGGRRRGGSAGGSRLTAPASPCPGTTRPSGPSCAGT